MRLICWASVVPDVPHTVCGCTGTIAVNSLFITRFTCTHAPAHRW